MKTITLSDSAYAELAAVFTTKTPQPPVPVDVPAGYTLLPVTGHVLPLAKPEQNSFWGYLIVNGRFGQNGPQDASLGFQLLERVTGKPAATITPADWPLAMDILYNEATYDPEGVAARKAAIAAAEKDAWIATHNPTPQGSTEEV